jgi:hypothetical protein
VSAEIGPRGDLSRECELRRSETHGPHFSRTDAAGHLMARRYRGSEVPRPFNPTTIKRMIEGPTRRSGRLSGFKQGQQLTTMAALASAALFWRVCSCSSKRPEYEACSRLPEGLKLTAAASKAADLGG